MIYFEHTIVLYMLPLVAAIYIMLRTKKVALRCVIFSILLIAISCPKIASSLKTPVAFIVDCSISAKNNDAAQKVLADWQKSDSQNRTTNILSFATDVHSTNESFPLKTWIPKDAILKVKNATSTNIDNALRAGNAVLKSNKGAIVLLSDGHSTQNQEGIYISGAPVACIPITHAKSVLDVAIEEIYVPRIVNQNTECEIQVILSSTMKTQGEVVLFLNGNEVSRASVNFKHEGRRAITFSVNAKILGWHKIKALYTTVDAININNKLQSAFFVQGKRSILWVGNSTVITKQNVKKILPREIPQSADDVRKYHTIILNNIERNEISESQERAISEYVRTGGGLITIGGNKAYGSGGWVRDDILSKILPITMTPLSCDNVHTIFLLDRSGSMTKEKHSAVNRAVLSAYQKLSKGRVSIIGFADSAEIISKELKTKNSARVLNALKTKTKIGRRTNLLAGILKVKELINSTQYDEVKLILLSDGIPEGYEHTSKELLAECLSITSAITGGACIGINISNTKNILTRVAKELKIPMHSPKTLSDIVLAFKKSVKPNNTNYITSDNSPPTFSNHYLAKEGLVFNLALRNIVGLNENSEMILGYSTSRGKEPVFAICNYELGKIISFAGSINTNTSDEEKLFWGEILNAVEAPQRNRNIYSTSELSNSNLKITVYNALANSKYEAVIGEKIIPLKIIGIDTIGCIIPQTEKPIFIKHNEEVIDVVFSPNNKRLDVMNNGVDIKALLRISEKSNGVVLKDGYEISSWLKNLSIKNSTPITQWLIALAIVLCLIEYYISYKE